MINYTFANKFAIRVHPALLLSNLVVDWFVFFKIIESQMLCYLVQLLVSRLLIEESGHFDDFTSQILVGSMWKKKINKLIVTLAEEMFWLPSSCLRRTWNVNSGDGAWTKRREDGGRTAKTKLNSTHADKEIVFLNLLSYNTFVFHKIMSELFQCSLITVQFNPFVMVIIRDHDVFRVSSDVNHLYT